MPNMDGCINCRMVPTVGGHYTVFCPIHAAAPRMLAALKALICHATDNKPHTQSWVEARAILRDVEGSNKEKPMCPCCRTEPLILGYTRCAECRIVCKRPCAPKRS